MEGTEGTTQDLTAGMTEGSRYRKLALCTLALLAVHVTQGLARQPITWPVVVLDGLVVLAFVAGNVLARLADALAVQRAVERVQQMAAGGR